jgi:hypothetical protein
MRVPFNRASSDNLKRAFGNNDDNGSSERLDSISKPDLMIRWHIVNILPDAKPPGGRSVVQNVSDRTHRAGTSMVSWRFQGCSDYSIHAQRSFHQAWRPNGSLPLTSDASVWVNVTRAASLQLFLCALYQCGSRLADVFLSTSSEFTRNITSRRSGQRFSFPFARIQQPSYICSSHHIEQCEEKMIIRRDGNGKLAIMA